MLKIKIKKLVLTMITFLMCLSIVSCANENDNNDNKNNNNISSSTGSDSTVTSENSSDTDSSSSVSSKFNFPEKAFQTVTNGKARVKVDKDKLVVDGKELWINGVNSAWDNWNDFGGAFSLEFWMEHFRKLHDAGCNASRIWISCNGDVGMKISADGNFEGAETAHWEDLDDLFTLAENYQIYLMPTVQSFDHYKEENQTHEAWRTMVQDNDKIDKYVDNYIVPLVQRYGKSDYFWAVDLCNEPDWVVENPECGMLDWKYLQSYFARASAAIHENSNVLVTVGLAMIKYNSDDIMGNYISDDALQKILGDNSKYDKSKAYVDFYSTHWYPWMIANWGTNYSQSPKDYKQDISKPCIIAELPAKTSDVSNYDITSVYEQAYKNGWKGVMAWKASGGDDGNGSLIDIVPALKKMNSVCKDKIFPLGQKD